jgi:hypothetical protein
LCTSGFPEGSFHVPLGATDDESRHGELTLASRKGSAVTGQVLFALAAGLAGGLLVWFYSTRYAPGVWSDFDQVWLGSRAILEGRDPYQEVLRSFPWPLYYPLPTLLLGLPFAPWSLLTARVLFAVVTAGVGVWAILRYRSHAWPLLLSAPFVYGIARGQWAPVLVAAALIPWLGGLAIVKPSIGLATFAAYPSRRAVVGVAILVVLSLLVHPSWPAAWWHGLQTTPHLIVPALKPGGIILLAALGRWRRADARLLAVLASVPQTPSPYDLFPMALIPATLRQSLIMGLSWNVLYLVTLATHDTAPLTLGDVSSRKDFVYWPVHFVLGYFPALMAVLSPSPLVDRPRDFSTWTAGRQRAYRVAWGAVLGVVGSVALLWAYLIWAGA